MISLVVIVIAFMFRKSIVDFLNGSIVLDIKNCLVITYREFWRAFHVAQDRKVNGIYWQEVREGKAEAWRDLKSVI